MAAGRKAEESMETDLEGHTATITVNAGSSETEVKEGASEVSADRSAAAGKEEVSAKARKEEATAETGREGHTGIMTANAGSSGTEAKERASEVSAGSSMTTGTEEGPVQEIQERRISIRGTSTISAMRMKAESTR